MGLLLGEHLTALRLVGIILTLPAVALISPQSSATALGRARAGSAGATMRTAPSGDESRDTRGRTVQPSRLVPIVLAVRVGRGSPAASRSHGRCRRRPRRRYKKALADAKLRTLRFHDLRHSFGSIAIDEASIVQVQAWMGHADVQTTMKYMHQRSRAGDARLLSAAFRPTKRARRSRSEAKKERTPVE